MKDSCPFLSESQGSYCIAPGRSVSADQIIEKAKFILARRMRRKAYVLSSPSTVRDYLLVRLAGEQVEKFWGLFLDNRHRVINHEVLFTGTLDSAAVYPRVVVTRALSLNAAAVIFAHNHPSGVCEPSDTDVRLTRKLVDALALIDVRVLDHLVVGSDTTTSLAERGLM